MRRIMLPYAANSETLQNSSTHAIALLGQNASDISRKADNGHQSPRLPAKQVPKAKGVAKHPNAISPMFEAEPAAAASFGRRWLREFIRRLASFLSHPPQDTAFRTSPLPDIGYRWSFDGTTPHDPGLPISTRSQPGLAGAGRLMLTMPSESATQGRLTPRLENSVLKTLEQHLEVRLPATPQAKPSPDAKPPGRSARIAIAHSEPGSALRLPHIK